MNKEKYLPIGSVVLLKNAEKELMIDGYASISIDNPNKVYDYVGCLYPEGRLDNKEVQLFDHVQIDKILFLGYETELSTDYIEEMKNDINLYESKKIYDESILLDNYERLD